MSRIPIHQKDFLERGLTARNLQFAVRALERIYGIPGPTVAKRKIFYHLVWLITESDGKYSIRYRSEAAINAPAREVRHDHVFPIIQLYKLSRRNLAPSEVLKLCTACLVTREEHSKLHATDHEIEGPMGWQRYLRARIKVYDMLEKRILTGSEMKASNAIFEKALQDAKFIDDGEELLEIERKAKQKSLRAEM